MMGSANNIQRDGIWIKPNTASDLTWPTPTLHTATEKLANADSTVYDRSAQFHTGMGALALNGGYSETVGCYIKQPLVDNTPYRVIASAEVIGQQDNIYSTFLTIGYAPSSPTGTDDSIEECYSIPFKGCFDGLIMVPNLSSGDTFYGRALFIGVSIGVDANLSGQYGLCAGSVQRLATSPPTLAQAVP